MKSNVDVFSLLLGQEGGFIRTRVLKHFILSSVTLFVQGQRSSRNQPIGFSQLWWLHPPDKTPDHPIRAGWTTEEVYRRFWSVEGHVTNMSHDLLPTEFSLSPRMTSLCVCVSVHSELHLNMNQWSPGGKQPTQRLLHCAPPLFPETSRPSS